MTRPEPGLRDQGAVRSVLRIGGPIVFGIGLLLTIVAFVDFFGVFASPGEMPTNFWMAFVGLPLMALGGALARAGYLGPATRYVAGEVTPTIRDTLGALGIGSGLACPRCGAANDEQARFCDACGTPLRPSCPACGAENAPAARFCSSCGKPLPA